MKTKLYLATVFITALLVRLTFLAWWQGDPLVPDSSEYLSLARNLAAGRGFSADGIHPGIYRAPLYPAFIAAVYALFGENLRIVQGLQCLLDSMAAVWIFLLGLLLANPRVALFSGMAYAVHPIFVSYAFFMQSEALFFHLWFLFLLICALALERAKIGLFLASGALLGLVVLCRPAPLYFPAFLLPVALLRSVSWRRALLCWIVLILGFMAVLSPWTIRNQMRFHRLIPVMTGGGVAWWIGSLTHYPGMPDLLAVDPSGDFKSPEGDAAFMREAKKNWKERLVPLSAHLPYRLLKFWVTSHSAVFGIDQPNALYWRQGSVLLLTAKVFLLALQLIVLGAGFWGLWVLRSEWKSWVLVALPILYFSFHILNDWGPRRYHLPALPSFFILAFWAWDRRRTTNNPVKSGSGPILIICHEFPPVGGGGGRGAYFGAREFAKARPVDVLTSAAPGLKSRESIEGMNVYRVGLRVPINLETGSRPKSYFAFFAFCITAIYTGFLLCRCRRYETIYTHFVIPAGFLGVIFSRLFAIPHVGTIVEADLFDPRAFCTQEYRNPLLRALIRWTMDSTQYLAAISRAVAQTARIGYKTSTPIRVIHYGLPRLPEPNLSRAVLGLQEGVFALVFIGRLVRRKGLDVLLEALSRIGNRQWQLIVIGEGPERERLDQLSREYGMGGQVFFLGYLEQEKYDYLSVSDAFVLPSHHEGLGIALMEAMSLGLPVISTDSGGQRDLITDGQNGLLVRPGDPQALAHAIEKLMGDSALCKRLSEDSRIKARSFSVAAMGEAYSELAKDATEAFKRL